MNVIPQMVVCVSTSNCEVSRQSVGRTSSEQVWALQGTAIVTERERRMITSKPWHDITQTYISMLVRILRAYTFVSPFLRGLLPLRGDELDLCAVS